MLSSPSCEHKMSFQLFLFSVLHWRLMQISIQKFLCFDYSQVFYLLISLQMGLAFSFLFWGCLLLYCIGMWYKFRLLLLCKIMSPTNTNIFYFLFLTWMLKCTYLLDCIGWRCSRVLYKDGQSCLPYLRRGCFCIFSLSIMLVVGLYILYDRGIVCICFCLLRALCHEKMRNRVCLLPLSLIMFCHLFYRFWIPLKIPGIHLLENTFSIQ